MTLTVFTSLLLLLGWTFAIAIGIGIVAMAYYVGWRYVFTSTGVTRTGPPIGREIKAMRRQNQHDSSAIGQLISRKQWTLIIFLVAHNRLTELLLPHVMRFAALINQDIQILIIVDEIDDTLQAKVMQSNTILIEDKGSRMGSKLGVRAMPFALLVDNQATLLGKEVVGEFVHLCYLMEAIKILPHNEPRIFEACREQP